MYSLLLFYKIPWWPAQRETEGEKREKEACPILHSRNHWWEKRGAVPGFVHREEHFVSDQPSQSGRKRQWEEGGRAEGWGLVGGAACAHCQFVVLLGCHQLVSWFVCLLDWWMWPSRPLPLVPPGLKWAIDRVLTGQSRSRQMVSLSLRGKIEAGRSQRSLRLYRNIHRNLENYQTVTNVLKNEADLTFILSWTFTKTNE